jgi:hypothetical protein
MSETIEPPVRSDYTPLDMLLETYHTLDYEVEMPRRRKMLEAIEDKLDALKRDFEQLTQIGGA